MNFYHLHYSSHNNKQQESLRRKETHKILRLVRRVSSLGIDPVNSLLFSRLSHHRKRVSKPSRNLYTPQKVKIRKKTNQHKHAYRNFSDFNLPNDFGIFPSNLLSYKSMLISVFKFPSSLGIFPLRSFL